MRDSLEILVNSDENFEYLLRFNMRDQLRQMGVPLQERGREGQLQRMMELMAHHSGEPNLEPVREVLVDDESDFIEEDASGSARSSDTLS